MYGARVCVSIEIHFERHTMRSVNAANADAVRGHYDNFHDHAVIVVDCERRSVGICRR